MSFVSFFVSPPRRTDATIGTTVNATRSDDTITIQMVMPISSMKRMNPPPVAARKIMGMNTHMVVSVDAMMGIATAVVPRRAAVRGSSSRSVKWREIDSMTTTELSTSIPTASMSPIKLTTLIVVVTKPSCRKKYRMTKVRMIEMGIEIATSAVVRTFRRKRKRKTTARTPPRSPALRSCPSP